MRAFIINKYIISFTVSFFFSVLYIIFADLLVERYTVRFDLLNDRTEVSNIQIYYTYKGLDSLSEQQSSFCPKLVKKDVYTKIKCHINLPFKSYIGKIRFDIGNHQGHFTIKNVKINGIHLSEEYLSSFIFNEQLKLINRNELEFSLESNGTDPYFIINKEIDVEPKLFINDLVFVVFLFIFIYLLSFDIINQLEYKKIIIKSTDC